MSELRIAVHGATGRLGLLVVEELGDGYAGPIEREGPVPDCDVVIDVSSAEGLVALLPRLSGQALVVGTTGDLPDLEPYAQRAPVALVPNFSAGVPVLLDLLAQAVERLPDWDVEVVETHHRAKLDAPSGTARRLVEAVGRAVPTHSLRVGDTFGEHTVWLSGPGERLELTHVATRREVFAIGAVRCARWLVNQPAGLHRL
ncbi:MAG: dihydrodipicolinate reductase C-terminal domain-containing protein [Myxococcota bacterium]|jgi:4-hydroxy-tetrahydrodipicolinate reductase|nr:dihydrodipicolinate reductase C-terminal domain-containing protein [Myxococcota bacterium]